MCIRDRCLGWLDDDDYKPSDFSKKVNELMDDGYDFGEAVREAMRQGYNKGGSVKKRKIEKVTQTAEEYIYTTGRTNGRTF